MAKVSLLNPAVSMITTSLAVNPDNARQMVWQARPVDHFADQWACNVWNKRYVGKVAGHTTAGGVLQFSFGDVHIPGGIVAWVIANGDFPNYKIAFKDGDATNIAVDNIYEDKAKPLSANDYARWVVKFGGNMKHKRKPKTSKKAVAVTATPVDTQTEKPVAVTATPVKNTPVEDANSAKLYSIEQIRNATTLVASMDSVERELVKAILQDS